jgi:centromeric protein E
MEKISVAVRFRPPTTAAPAADQSPSSTGGDREWRVDDDTRITLLHRSAPVPGASFAFDHVFDGAATNERIYGVLVRSLIRAAVDGFNGTAFAYGQTSSGKTFTMNGSADHPGIIPLAVRDVFDTAREVN